METIESEQMQQMVAIIRQFHTVGHFLHYNMGGCRGRKRILTILLDHPQMLQKELQEELQIQCGSLSEIVSKLEAEGLIQRRKCESDGRQMTISLTETGLESARLLRQNYLSKVEILLNCFSEEERIQLHCYLQRMLAHWSSDDCSHLDVN